MELDCEFKKVKIIRKSKVYTCRINAATITFAAIITDFKGEHKPDKQDSSVKGFLARKHTITCFPIRLDVHFPNLTHLAIESCGLASLTREDLKGFNDLENINFCNNELTSLPNDLFVGLRKLKCINFSCNKLEFLSSKLLAPILKGLRFVGFRKNTKIDASYRISGAGTMTMDQLMDTMDKMCKGPSVDPRSDVQNVDDHRIQTFGHMWKPKAFTDFTIVTKNSKEIPVNKCVLGSRSSVFAAAFNIDMEEKRTNRMTIDSFSPEAVEQFLKSLYYGRIPNDFHAMELFGLASQYDVPLLKEECERAVLRNLDEDNAFEIFSLGHLHSSKNLKENAFIFIKKSMPGKPLNDSFKENPEKLRSLVEAARVRAQKMQAVEDEFNAVRKIIEEPEPATPWGTTSHRLGKTLNSS